MNHPDAKPVSRAPEAGLRVLSSALALLLLSGCCRVRPRCPCPAFAAPTPRVTVAPAAQPPAGSAKTDPPRATWPPAAARTMEAGQAPTPYTAAQIRAACPRGRVARFRMDVQGGLQMIQTFHWVESDAEGCVIEVTVTDATGKTLSPAKRGPRQSWSALQAHAAYPADQTVITEETIETPAGSFDCFLYVVTRLAELGPRGAPRAGDPGLRAGPTTLSKLVDQYWFAKALPGPPVLTRMSVGGPVAVSMELTLNTQPQRARPLRRAGR